MAGPPIERTIGIDFPIWAKVNPKNAMTAMDVKMSLFTS
jgi:hypothetical protein